MSKHEWLTNKRLFSSAVLVALLFVPLDAGADAGIPMLPLGYPIVWLMLIPVVIVEALYVVFKLRMPANKILGRVTLANLVTTLIGFPIAWIAALLWEFAVMIPLSHTNLTLLDRHPKISSALSIFLFPAWLGSFDQRWPLAIAFVVLLIPTYFLSYVVEWRILRRFAWEETDANVRLAVRNANLCSYVLLALVGVVLLMKTPDFGGSIFELGMRIVEWVTQLFPRR